MNTIKITTSQNIDLEYESASLGDRLVAWIIDIIIIIAYYIAAIALTIGFSSSGGSSGTQILLVILVLPLLFYHLLSEILLNGQSAGKKVMHIKVISLDGGQPKFSQYLIRWLFRFVDFTMSSGLVAFVLVIVTEKKQRLGDIIAGTTLVKTTPRTEIAHTLYSPAKDPEYQLTYPEVINLKDSDIELIKEVLRNFHTTGNSMLTLQAQQKVEQVLHIMSKQKESWEFLGVILKDYYYVTSEL